MQCKLTYFNTLMEITHLSICLCHCHHILVKRNSPQLCTKMNNSNNLDHVLFPFSIKQWYSWISLLSQICLVRFYVLSTLRILAHAIIIMNIILLIMRQWTGDQTKWCLQNIYTCAMLFHFSISSHIHPITSEAWVRPANGLNLSHQPRFKPSTGRLIAPKSIDRQPACQICDYCQWL